MAKARRTPLLIASLAAALAVVATACERRPVPTAGANGSAFTDEAGRRVVLRAAPTRRVVSLAPNVTELLFAIGAGNQIVGVDNYSDAPAGLVERIPKVGSDYEPSLEKIVALMPDVVFASVSANRRETIQALERLGVPVFVTDTRGIADVDRALTNLGAVTGHAGDAQQQILHQRSGFDAVRRRVAGRPRPQVLVVVWDDPLYVAGRVTFPHDLIELAGGTNVVADAVGFARYPLERILRAGPEVLVLPTHGAATDRPRSAGYWSRWTQLPAVRSKRVYTVDDAIISRPGARLVEGAELLARIIHSGGAPN